MSLRVVRLGFPRAPDEGLRLGTVRRPPRGVPKAEFSKRDFYDVWFPNLAPSEPIMHGYMKAKTPAAWRVFSRQYRAEMASPAARHDIALLAELSHRTNFSVGCYCEDESRCHRSILRQLLSEAGADIAAGPALPSRP